MFCFTSCKWTHVYYQCDIRTTSANQMRLLGVDKKGRKHEGVGSGEAEKREQHFETFTFLLVFLLPVDFVLDV